MLTGFFAFTTILFGGLYWLQCRYSKRIEQSHDNAKEKLDSEVYWHGYYRDECRLLTAKLREANLPVVATMTGPDSMNIAGGYRYPATNS